MAAINQHFDVPGDDFTRAGEASGKAKGLLKKLGYSPEVIRKVAISMYEAEINMVIHANGGTMEMSVDPDRINLIARDTGPGIPDVDLAMQEGYSTAPDDVRALGFGAGMGLPNIKKYTDKLVIDSRVGKGTTLDMTVYTQTKQD